MINSTAEKITLLNKVTLESLGEHNKLIIIKKFSEASIQSMNADFGFAWWRPNTDDEYELIYKSQNIPYEPNPPRKRGGNYQAKKTGMPFFVEDTDKEQYAKQYDVRPYMKSYVIIPIEFDENFYGSIVLCYEQRKVFTKEDKSIAQALGNALAQALTISRLHHNLSNFQKTLDNTLDSIFIFDPKTLKMRYVNHGATLFSGQDRESLLELSLDEIVTNLTKLELFEKITEIQSNPDQAHSMFESSLAHPEKGKIPVEIYLQQVIQKDQPEQFLGFVRDISERKQTENAIRKMAYYDPLTGLPNRALLTERLEEAQALAEERKNMYALFFIDLDHFKVINDIYGHHVGDLLLSQVARRMQKAIPKRATLARMGGDEFLILLPDLDTVEEAERCAVKIQDVFTEFFELNEQEIYSNGSIGFAIFPLDGVDPSTLLKHADLALHRAKEHGGGNIQQYRIGQPLFYTMQPKLQSELRKAIKRNELVLHYQPVISLKSKKIIGSEALVRWNHPEMGLIMPGAFIGQAEESGLIVEIGQWVIEETCRQIQKWESEGRTPPPVSINISPRELLKPTLVSNFENYLQKYKISPSQIKVELTETFLMKNIELSISILEQLKSLGLRIMIDDFGTGYASLNYLKQLPIDAIKIDKTFIQGVPVNLQDAALTSAIIAIAHQLGLHVIGEGVETQDQYEFLRAAQCNYGQGNFFYTPLPGDDFAKLLNLAI